VQIIGNDVEDPTLNPAEGTIGIVNIGRVKMRQRFWDDFILFFGFQLSPPSSATATPFSMPTSSTLTGGSLRLHPGWWTIPYLNKSNK